MQIMSISELIATYSNFLGPFLGVIIAFILSNIANKITNHNKRYYYLISIKKELHQSKNDLIEQQSKEGLLFPLRDNVWNSLLSSGSLQIFKYNEIASLILIYSYISRYNDYLLTVSNDIDNLNKLADPFSQLQLKTLYDDLNKFHIDKTDKEALDKLKESEETINQYYTELELKKRIIIETPKIIRPKLIYILDNLLKQPWLNKDNFFVKIFPRYMKTDEEKSLIKLIDESYDELGKDENLYRILYRHP